MAKTPTKPPLIRRVIDSAFRGRYTETQMKPFAPVLVGQSDKLYTDTERESLLRIASQSDSPTAGAATDPLEYFGALSRKSIADTLDNDQIMQMAPEISLAASIMIPSILAPNDLREEAIQFICDAENLSEAEQKKIGETVTDFAENYFKFSTALPHWIEEAMYRSGAKVLLTLPLTILEKQLTARDNLIGLESMSVEAFGKLRDEYHNTSVFGFADQAHDQAAGVESLLSTESFRSAERNFLNECSSDTAKKLSGTSDPFVKKFARLVLSQENINLIDNPDYVSINKLKVRATQKSLSEKALRYRTAEYDSLPEWDPNEKLKGNPLFSEIPTGAVIPIYTPGTPSDHLGYYIIHDEFGHPIDGMDTTHNGLFNQGGASGSGGSTNRSDIASLYQAYGLSGRGMLNDQIPEQNVMATLYHQIVESHLKQRTERAGYTNVELGQNSALYRCLFTRFLQQRRTRILFVPKEFVTYFCFKYSQYGTGVSKLDDLKWILSLRISLLVSRMLTAMKNAIDSKLIEITFDDKFAGNVLQHMRTAQREAINKDLMTFSYDPAGVTQQIAERSYSVKVANIPGMPNYQITRDQDTRSSNGPQPDTDLSADIKNMEILGLEVPPAVMNNLNDAEFSRSVATTNIVFSRKLSVYQKTVCHHLTQLIRHFITYSKPLTQAISEILASGRKNAANEKGTVVDNDKKGINLNHIIRSITATLPSPNMAPNSAQFTGINDMITAFSTIADNYIPDDIAGDDSDLKETLGSIRALVKSEMVQNVVRRSGITGEDFPDILHDFDPTHLLKIRQSLLNIGVGVKRLMSAQNVANPDGTGTDPSSSNLGGFGDDTTSDSVDDFGSSTPSSPGDGTDADATPPSDGAGASPDNTSSGTGEEAEDDVGDLSGGPSGSSLV